MIKVYTTKLCPKCEALKKKLMLERVVFMEVNVREDDDAMAELVMHNIHSPPAIEIDGMFFALRE